MAHSQFNNHRSYVPQYLRMGSPYLQVQDRTQNQIKEQQLCIFDQQATIKSLVEQIKEKDQKINQQNERMYQWVYQKDQKMYEVYDRNRNLEVINKELEKKLADKDLEIRDLKADVHKLKQFQTIDHE